MSKHKEHRITEAWEEDGEGEKEGLQDAERSGWVAEVSLDRHAWC